MIYNITEQTFESQHPEESKEAIDPNNIKLLVSNYNPIEFNIKKKHAEKNNIFKEIEIIKEKENNNLIDYIKVLKITRKIEILNRD